MYEKEIFEFICAQVQAATGVKSVIKGYPTFGRITLAPPVVAVEIGTIDLATETRIGALRTVQRWNVIVYGSNEPEKVRMVGAVKDWIRATPAFTLEDGPRISLRLVTGEPQRPLTDAQTEQYGYLFVIEAH